MEAKNRRNYNENRILGIKIRNFVEGTMPLQCILMTRLDPKVMCLPPGYKTSKEYFYHANEFLKQNSWIYREANTEFLKAGIPYEMPPEFKDYFLQQIVTQELNKFPYVHEPLENLSCNTLIKFRQELAELIPPEAFSEPTDFGKTIKLQNPKKMNVKKQHEIQRLATLVQKCLEKQPAEGQQKYVLVDLGSGLGYLSELLYKLNENVLILGLEADEYRVGAAQKRLQTFLPAATNCIQYRQHFVSENSKDFITQTIEEVFKLNYQCMLPQPVTTKMAIIGLHACADLTISSMKLFLQLPHVQQLIIMPCCYHKLKVCDDVAATNTRTKNFNFINFPLSESLKHVLLDNTKENLSNDSGNGEPFTMYLNRPFLRLACQQTLKRWSNVSNLQHRIHGCEMFFRAVAELLLSQREDEIEKEEEEENEFMIIKRKENKIELNSLTDEHLENFETFSSFYVLKRRATQEIVEWTEKHRNKFNAIVEKYPHGAKMAESLTCLQTSMQKFCENLVLYDRLCYMEERALKMNLNIKVRYEKIMDEELSPRCYVLIAEKI